MGQASTSTRGVTAKSINVVFPVVSLSSLAGKLGFAEDAEYGEQKKAIKLFVNQVNKSGGIHGRRINPIIATFTPENTSAMRALCKDWTEGSPAAFAVLDGEGAWSGTNELCVTEEGHTPFIGQWTTVSNWTTDGSPYLWWTGPSDTQVIQATVDWGLATGLIGGSHKVGVIAGDRASDKLALDDYLLPDLRRAGVRPVVETIASSPTEIATTNAQAPLVVQKLKAAGVTSVIPILPFNAFDPVLGAETAQHYFPKLLLSDYEESIESAQGLLPPGPYEQALTGQEGVTTETLGGVDDTRPESQGGYDTGVRDCWKVWHAAYPETPPGNQNDFIEEQGPVQGWCQEIRLFTAAAKAAGRDLNRRTFVEAMSRIRNFPGGFAPVLSYGPRKFSGPVQYRIVSLHSNMPPTSICKMPKDGIPQGRCWVVKQDWRPLPPTG
ncbi:MAG: ABC transporter substrate-binding protein [Acidimicrobiales bacterium]